ncbi:Zinc finger protein 516 [Clonorchis sinensis]|uniref:KRAB domain-containing zinc finger protein n=2 Tax=Clonorchis sinensis TaxID=79923 RepID=H2KSU1_CLOSI|nr:Zinc finger protein 516 [Clonorchis sinensis]GAA35545.1 KRAB domain-containing zinc finger protein [Clonorchis sinensis]
MEPSADSEVEHTYVSTAIRTKRNRRVFESINGLYQRIHILFATTESYPALNEAPKRRWWNDESIANHTYARLLIGNAHARDSEKMRCARQESTNQPQKRMNKIKLFQHCKKDPRRGTQDPVLHECTLCNKTFPRKWRLRRHATIHSDIKQYKCNHCEQTYAYKWGLKEHVNRVHQDKCSGEKIQKHECRICSRMFLRRDHLIQHMRVHSGEKPFGCKFCKTSFSAYGNLQRHLRTIHLKAKDTQLYEISRATQINDSPVPCGIQGNTSEETSDFACSIPVAEQDKAPSEEDGKTVGDPLSTTDGTKQSSHSNKCPVCGRTFVNTWNLKRHAVVHTHRNFLECEICKQQFKYILSLRDHRLLVHSHREDDDCREVHRCHVCGKPFLRKDSLDEHFRAHSKERPFECNLCGSKFTLACNLKKHQRQLHSAESSSAESSTNPTDSHL